MESIVAADVCVETLEEKEMKDLSFVTIETL